MESNNFSDIVKVIWESLGAGAGSSAPTTFTFEVAALGVFGIAAIVMMRRYQAKLASARTLQPGAAADIQHALRPAARPLSAPMHPTAVMPVPTIVASDTSHAA